MSSPGFGAKSVTSWDDMATWLAESFDVMPVGSILDLGPGGELVTDAEDLVVCAQVRKLDDDALWLRVSDRILGVPLVIDLSTEGLAFDVWATEGLFDDCSEGQIFSRNAVAIADLCVSWFRDRRGVESFNDLGFDFLDLDELPRTEDDESDDDEDDESIFWAPPELSLFDYTFAIMHHYHPEFDLCNGDMMRTFSGHGSTNVHVDVRHQRVLVIAEEGLPFSRDAVSKPALKELKRLFGVDFVEVEGELRLRRIVHRGPYMVRELQAACEDVVRLVSSWRWSFGPEFDSEPDVLAFSRWRQDWDL